MIAQKTTREGIARNAAFQRWATEKGYFPHSKYAEAFSAGAQWKAEQSGTDCDRPGGCVCGGDVPAIRRGCGWYVSD